MWNPVGGSARWARLWPDAALSILTVIYVFLPWLADARIPGCAAISIWGAPGEMQCVAALVSGPGTAIALSVYGALIPVGYALTSVLFLRSRLLPLVVGGLGAFVVGATLLPLSSLTPDGAVHFRTGPLSAIVTGYTLCAMATIAWRDLGSGREFIVSTWLRALSAALIASVGSAVLVDAFYIPQQIRLATPFIGVGARDFGDAIFLAGWVAVAAWVLGVVLGAKVLPAAEGSAPPGTPPSA